ASLCRCRRRAAGERSFDEGLDVGVQDAAFRTAALHLREIDAELARKFADRRTRVWLAGGFLARLARYRPRSRRSCRRGAWWRGRSLGRVRFRFRSGRSALLPCLEHEDRHALRHLITGLDLDLFHDAGGRRRYLHRRLVGLQRDERLFLRDGVARLDQHFDDLDFLEVADVGDDYRLIHTVTGSALSGSMPYFLIASATVFAFPSPWSASALRAAMVTK